LIDKLIEIEKSKKKGLQLQKDDLNFGIENIIGSCKMIENSLTLSTQNDVRLLSMKKLYHSRLDYLLNNQWKIEPCDNSLIQFSINQKEEKSIYSTISKIGNVDSNEISADTCVLSRDEKEGIIESEEFKFEIITYSIEGD